MKKLLLSCAAIGALIATPALAADLGTLPHPYYKAAPPVETCSWCGFYIGGNVGYSWADANSTFTNAGAPSGSDTTHPDGVIGGGQLGFNWQTGPAVFGIETDIQGSGQRNSVTALAGAVPGFGPITITQTDKLPWFGTTRARLGFAPDGGSWLLYATGGVAYGEVSSTLAVTGAGPPPPGVSLSNSTTRIGWTAGGGLEYRFLPRWSFKVEYLYMDLGTSNFEIVPATPGLFTQRLRLTDNIARVGINYHFGGGPLYSRY